MFSEISEKLIFTVRRSPEFVGLVVNTLIGLILYRYCYVKGYSQGRQDEHKKNNEPDVIVSLNDGKAELFDLSEGLRCFSTETQKNIKALK